MCAQNRKNQNFLNNKRSSWNKLTFEIVIIISLLLLLVGIILIPVINAIALIRPKQICDCEKILYFFVSHNRRVIKKQALFFFWSSFWDDKLFGQIYIFMILNWFNRLILKVYDFQIYYSL